MIEWVAVFVALCLLASAAVALFFLRFWMLSCIAFFTLRVKSHYTRRIHEEHESGFDVLVIFSDPAFLHVDLRPLIHHFEAAHVIYINTHYHLDLSMYDHAQNATELLLKHYLKNPDKRYTFVGLGIGGFMATYCAGKMPLDTNTYATINFEKDRARLILVGTPINGCRTLYNFANAPFTYKDKICDLLTPNSEENLLFWKNISLYQRSYILVSATDFRASAQQQINNDLLDFEQSDPETYKFRVHHQVVYGVPWYGLLTAQNVQNAVDFLWNHPNKI